MCLTGLEKNYGDWYGALNFLKVLWTGHENLEKFQLNFPDPVIPINNERSLIAGSLVESKTDVTVHSAQIHYLVPKCNETNLCLLINFLNSPFQFIFNPR